MGVDTKAARASMKALEASFTSGVLRVLENAGAACEKAARASQAFKDQTGRLRASIRHRVRSMFVVDVIADTPYAGWVEDGNHPNNADGRIHPIHGKRLRFKVGGTTVFAKSVAPIKPRHYMRDAQRALAPIFERNLRAVMNTAIEKHNH